MIQSNSPKIEKNQLSTHSHTLKKSERSEINAQNPEFTVKTQKAPNSHV